MKFVEIVTEMLLQAALYLTIIIFTFWVSRREYRSFYRMEIARIEATHNEIRKQDLTLRFQDVKELNARHAREKDELQQKHEEELADFRSRIRDYEKRLAIAKDQQVWTTGKSGPSSHGLSMP